MPASPFVALLGTYRRASKLSAKISFDHGLKHMGRPLICQKILHLYLFTVYSQHKNDEFTQLAETAD